LTAYGGEETMAMARLLLDWGADPNARTRFGGVPLFDCVRDKKIEFVELLLEFGVAIESLLFVLFLYRLTTASMINLTVFHYLFT
jgi:ankyrin repeat protein